ncbi:spore coat protein U domain-containing protein [Cupriavidus sp. 30B13]|uniref:spore coat protein U domain-containing protein n=1 Tax=Cupriavidus sp. 30B13 TaxID=3384241 RepID=UPI003B90CBDD
MKITSISAAAIACACAWTAALAQAGSSSLNGAVNARLVLTTGCAIDAGTGSTGVLANFGTLDFGAQPGGFTGKVTAQAVGGGAAATQMTCSPDVTALQVTLDAGQNGGKGAGEGIGSRALANGTNYVPYEVYSDAAHAHPYVAGTAHAVPVPAPGATFSLPIHGVVHKTSTSALAAGTYLDTLNVTLAW